MNEGERVEEYKSVNVMDEQPVEKWGRHLACPIEKTENPVLFILMAGWKPAPLSSSTLLLIHSFTTP